MNRLTTFKLIYIVSLITHCIITFSGLYLSGGFASETSSIPTVTHNWVFPLMGYAHGSLCILSFMAQLFDPNITLLWYDAPNNYQFYVHVGIFSFFTFTLLSKNNLTNH